MNAIDELQTKSTLEPPSLSMYGLSFLSKVDLSFEMQLLPLPTHLFLAPTNFGNVVLQNAKMIFHLNEYKNVVC